MRRHAVNFAIDNGFDIVKDLVKLGRFNVIGHGVIGFETALGPS